MVPDVADELTALALPSQIPEPIQSFMAEMHGRGFQVWMLGSRVNGTATDESDWDVLIFGNEELLRELVERDPVSDDCDLLVVLVDATFRKPWSENPERETGNCTLWKWQEQSGGNTAIYKGENPDYEVPPPMSRAVRYRTAADNTGGGE